MRGLNRKCGSDTGNGWLIKHSVIAKQSDDIIRGGEKGRGWPRFSVLCWGESLPGFLFPPPWKNNHEDATEIIHNMSHKHAAV